MAKLKPKLNEDRPPHRPFYGSAGLTSRIAVKRKTTCICPNPNCSYAARVWIAESESRLNQKTSTQSSNCPVHRLPLINVGFASTVPKAGTKERKLLIESLKS